jgi:two-component system NtrC family sensor kinase
MSIVQHHLAALLISASSILILTLFVFFKDPRKKINRVFAFYSFCIVLWSFGQAYYISAINTFDSVFGSVIFHSGAIFISSAFVHFVYTLLKLDKTKNRIVIFLYIGSFIFMTADLITFNFQGKASGLLSLRPPLLISILLFWSGSVLYAFILLFKAYGRSSGLRKKQFKFLITGSLLGYIGGGTNLLPALVPDILQFNPFATYAVPVYGGITAYAIYRYRLMGINMHLKRGMVYSLSAGLLMGLFVVLVLTITNALSVYTRVDSFKISLISALTIAFLFNPLRHRIQELIDRIFYKKTYNYYSTLQKVSSGLSSKFDLQEICDFIGNEVCNVMGLRDICVLSYVPETGYRVISHTSIKSNIKNGHSEDSGNAATSLELEPSLDIVRYYLNTKEIIIKDELSGLEGNPGTGLVESINRSFDLFHGEVMVPVLVESKPSLLLMIGEKMSCDIFTSEDISLFSIISEQMAIAVQHSELYKDKIHSERLASIGMMAATFAHEIRNPLTSLKTFAQLMPEKYNDREFRETFAKIVEGEIDKIDGLINDLLDFSTHKKASRMNNFNLVSLVDETVDYVKGKAPYSTGSITVQKKYSEREILMTGDASKLNQAFVNIITNGYQAMNGKGQLTVDINPNGNNVKIVITDTGEGIETESIAKIFDPFVTTKEMGIGLGLAISKRIIEDHRGELNVESAVSAGTSFTITLPVQNGA